MTRRIPTCAALLAIVPLAGAPLASAMAQGSLSTVVPAGDAAQAATVARGYSSGHRPFFYWLTGDSSDSSPAATPAPAQAASPPSPIASEPVLPAGMKTGTSIGVK